MNGRWRWLGAPKGSRGPIAWEASPSAEPSYGKEAYPQGAPAADDRDVPGRPNLALPEPSRDYGWDGAPPDGTVSLRGPEAVLTYRRGQVTIQWTNGAQVAFPSGWCVDADVRKLDDSGVIQFACRFTPAVTRPRSPDLLDHVAIRMFAGVAQEAHANWIADRLRPAVTEAPGDDTHASAPRSTYEPRDESGEQPVTVAVPYMTPATMPTADEPLVPAWGTNSGEPLPVAMAAGSGEPPPAPGSPDRGIPSDDQIPSVPAGAGSVEPDGPHIVTTPDTREWISFRPRPDTEHLIERLPRRPTFSSWQGPGLR